MLRGGEHGHIHSDFRNDADCGKGLDTRAVITSSSEEDISQQWTESGSRLSLHSSRLSMWERMMRSFSACSAHISPSTGGKDFFVSRFHVLGAESRNIRDFLRRVVQNTDSDGGGCLAEHIREHIIQFKVGDSQAVLRPIFLTGGEAGKFPTITEQVSKLADICGGIKLPATRSCLKMSAIHLASRLSVFFPGWLSHTWGEQGRCCRWTPECCKWESNTFRWIPCTHPCSCFQPAKLRTAANLR